MIITNDEKVQLHRCCLHDAVVAAALVGFLHRHIREYGAGIEVIADGIERFAEAMRSPVAVDLFVRIYNESLANLQAGSQTKQ